MNKAVLSLIVLLLCSLCNSKANAMLTVPETPTGYMMGLKHDMETLLAGDKVKSEGRRQVVCSMTAAKGQMVRQELGKFEYNDLFHELKSAEHIEDLKTLDQSLAGVDSCMKNLALWNAYDEKWYAAERKEKIKKYDDLKKKLAAEVVDTGKDIWDGFLSWQWFTGNALFSIPREYMNSGSNEPDGALSGAGLAFYYPGLDSKPFPENAPENPYGKGNVVYGVLSPSSFEETFPCQGFGDRKECTAQQWQAFFTMEALDCTGYSNVNKMGKNYVYSGAYLKDYRNRWRRNCMDDAGKKEIYSEKGYKNGEPVFDKDVGMWSIWDRYYFTGPKEFPDSWMICPKIPKKKDKTYDEDRNPCTSAFKVSEGTYFYYSFPQRMFWEFKDIQEQLKKKIGGWLKQPPQPVVDTRAKGTAP